ncbi:uncharacterized protein K02A2.6-like [Octopus sinensis]|uniref:Uncharacterized protein K02A2.6-like n=1 Tax=Octopus sinensis TaxID=2607531 RepID=A0A6P7U4B1_9MOLL|nr:uncharacterized protein K02A2.6-like [Octopus sinensis]
MFVPYQLHDSVLYDSHDTHLGIQQIINKISLEFWWPNMSQDVTTFISSSNSTVTWNKDGPREHIHMDWAFMNRIGNLLIVVNSYFNYTDAIPLPSCQKENIQKCLMCLFILLGLPKVTTSDNTPEFTALKGWLSTLGIKNIYIPTYHPQSNGQAKRAVQTIKHVLSAWNPVSDNWYPYLQRALFNH